MMKKILPVLIIMILISIGSAQESIRGIVFLDLNKNRKIDQGENGLQGVLVSNGREVSKSDELGNWQLPVAEDSLFFVIKPSGYAVALNENMIPQHAHLLRSTPGKEKPAEWGRLDFPLYKQKETNKFSVLLFGDPQARGLREVNFITHDVVEECIGTGAIFGVTLGDIVADDPDLFAEISQSIGKINIPWYNIFGNHDSDRQAETNLQRDRTFEQNFGPSTYAFEYGEIVFIGLNNIVFDSTGKYKPGFTEDQISFVGNYLTHIPDKKRIVLLMHAPIVACRNKESLFRLIENRPHTFSISAHLHEQVHLFVDKKFGWNGVEPHHHFINATVSGSWWCGLIDERGIPHATMNDGGPNGYSIITFDKTSYRIVYKAARRPADYQMNIYLPDDIDRTAIDTTKILVNVFAGSERSTVEIKYDQQDQWEKLEPVITIDPEVLRMHNLSPFLDKKPDGQPLEEIFGWKMDYPSKSRHMWQGKVQTGLAAGTHQITVRTTDMFGQTYQAYRIFRIR